MRVEFMCHILIIGTVHNISNLNRLWVIQVVAEVHEDLGHKLRHVVGERLHTGTETQDTGMPLDHQLGISDLRLLLFLDLCAAQLLKVGLETDKKRLGENKV